MTKVCTRCNTTKSLNDFYKNETSKDGQQNFCKSCSDAATYKRRDKNRDHWLVQNAANARHNLYGSLYKITPEEYVAMVKSQAGKCAICGMPETSTSRNGRVKTLFVDHDHVTGKVRQLLCHLCNAGLGAFRDSPSVMTSAVAYLHKHRAA